MNISSAVVKVREGQTEKVVSIIKSDKICEVALYKNNKIIVTMEAENLDGEIKAVKQLESIPEVLSVEIVYAYSEEELEQNRDKIERAGDFPEWLNDDTLKAGEIKYQGNLKKKI